MTKKNIKQLVSFKLLGVVLLFWMTNNCIFSLYNKQDDNTLSREKDVILEVTTEASRSVYPPGKVLDIRLYNNKEAEFDFYPPNTPNRIGIPFSTEIKRAKLNQKDYDKIKSLMKNPDLLKAKNRYNPTDNRTSDATIKKTITFKAGDQEKTIILEENDSHIYLEKSSLYPFPLIELLKLVNDINLELRKQIDPESR